MKIKITSILFSLLLLGFSCINNDKLYNAHTYTISDIQNEALIAQNENKKLVLLLTIDGCHPCELILNNMDDYFTPKHTRNLKKININTSFIENKIFDQLLYSHSFPLAIVIDSDFKIYGLISGAINYENSYCLMLDTITRGGIVVNSTNNLNLDKEEYRQFVTKIFKAQYFFEKEQYDKSLNLLSDIQKTTPYFYSYYLKSRAEKKIGLDTLSEKSAIQALAYNDNFSLFLYPQQQNEMKFMIDDYSKLNLNDDSHIAFETTCYDFGNIKMNNSYFHTFKFKNITSSPFAILDISFSCDCIEAKWSKQLLLPKNEDEITIQYEPKRLGEFSNIILIKSNYKSKPTSMLLVKGKVVEN